MKEFYRNFNISIKFSDILNEMTYPTSASAGELLHTLHYKFLDEKEDYTLRVLRCFVLLIGMNLTELVKITHHNLQAQNRKKYF